MALRRSAGDKLTQLRALMRSRSWEAYVVPTSDAHNSEYVADHDSRRAFISGFDGSSGTAVITQEHARLWTDGRYFLQAEKQLDAGVGWQLMKDRLPETPTIEAWLASIVPRGSAVAIDPFLFPISTVKRYKAALDAAGVALAADAHENLVDLVWGAEQPAVPATPVIIHELAYSGVDSQEKLRLVREAMAEARVDALVVAALDEIAWLFNIRGGDVECNPVTLSYALVTPTTATLFIDEGKLSPSVRAHVEAVASIAPYTSITDALSSLSGLVWMDPSYSNYALYQAASAGGTKPEQVVTKMSPVQLLKAVKNSVESAGMRAAHLRDGAALTTFFAWLEGAVVKRVDARTGSTITAPLTEFTVSQVLESFRAREERFVGLSFPTIAGMGPNGAIIHYRPEEATGATVTADSLFLCDSGAQYLDGTTDVTRTLHFGSPTPHQRLCYTRVLQGHIALAAATFPTGTNGIALDTLARTPLWKSGLDYRHGTGHGVGVFLNVHEGPFGASPTQRTTYEGGIVEGMTLTDEPGYYEDGNFGIRIENVMLARRAATPHCFGGKPYLEFETLTQVPICTKLVDVSLFTREETAWLNAYNAAVREALTPHMKGAFAIEYLNRETAPLNL